MKKWLSILLSVSLAMLIFPVNVMATETYTYSITPSNSQQPIGGEFDVIIALTNYATTTENIRGLQIDVSGIEPSILEVVSHSTSITDPAAASNKTSYSTSGKYIRLMYANMSGTLDKSTTEVLKIRFRIKDTLTSNGTITLPVSIKIVSTDGNTTQQSSIVIDYTLAAISIDVSWGNMQFTYDDGIWDSEQHKWVNSGWKPSTTDSNLITVRNTGGTDVKMRLSYNPLSSYSGLSGTFIDSSNTVIDSLISLGANGIDHKYWFNIYGTAETRWSDNYITIGTITLTITE